MRAFGASAIAAAMIAGAGARASAGPAEPAAVVERTPWLPAGLTEALATVTGDFAGLRHDKLYALRLELRAEVRHSFGFVEPIVGVTYWPLHLSYEDSLHDVYAGARVPITCLGGLRFLGRRWVPTHPDLLSYSFEGAYETRVPIKPGVASIHADGGVRFAHTWAKVPPQGDLTPATIYTSAWVDAFATAAIEVQASPTLALEAGVDVDIPGYDSHGTNDLVERVDAHAMALYALGDVDLIAKVTGTQLDRDYAAGLDLLLGAAARF